MRRALVIASACTLLGCASIAGLDGYGVGVVGGAPGSGGGASASGGSSTGGSSTGGSGASGTGGLGEGGSAAGTGGASGGGGGSGCQLLAFVTPQPHPPLGPVAANVVCQDAAELEGLDGTFVAWLATGNQSAVTALASGGHWCLVNGDPVFGDIDSLTIFTPETPIDIGPDNMPMNGVNVWTGADVSGAPTGSDCAGWTSSSPFQSGTIGQSDAMDATWTNFGMPTPCDGMAHLYCFEVPANL